MKPKSALTWLHLSDLHFCDSDSRRAPEQVRLLNILLEDIRQVISKSHRPDLVFLTGDVALSGTRREYEEAATWIKRLLSAIGLNKKQLFIVPGNHDVHRAKAIGKPVSELVHRALRRDAKDLDAILEHAPDVAHVLWPKFEEYANFASSYASTHLNGQLYWKSRIDTQLGSVHLVGLNTAILSFDNGEKPGDMRLGLRQLGEAVAGVSGELFIILIHHPLEWLADGPVLRETLNAHPHLILSGHTHDSSIDITSRRDRQPILELRAGAGQGSDPTHSWSLGRLSGAGLELWPRMWLPKRSVFSSDGNYDVPRDGYLRKSVEELPEPLKRWIKKRPRIPRPSQPGTQPQFTTPKLTKEGKVKVGDAIVICTGFAGHADALLTAGQDNDISWFDLSQPEHQRVVTPKGHRATVTSLAISPDGRRAVSAGIDESLIVWDLVSKSLVRRLHVGTYTYGLASTWDGTQFVAGDNFNQVSIWNFESDHPIVRLHGHTGWIHDLDISRDDRFVVSASMDKTLRLWELATGKALQVFNGHEWKVRSVVFSPDNERIISGDDRGHVFVWETSTGRILNRLHLHSRTVNSIVILGDGPFCVSSGRDNYLCLFRLDGSECLARRTLPDELNGMAISPCGRRLAVACDDGCVHLFAIA